MWEGPDTVGLLSCIIGTVLLFIPFQTLLMASIVLLGGGAAVLAMGIVAVAKDSKIGIGGIILGGILLFVWIFVVFMM